MSTLKTPIRKVRRPRPLPSLVDLCFIKVAANVDQYDAKAVATRVPFALKKQMLDFLMRIHNGRLPRPILDRLLDPNLQVCIKSPFCICAVVYI